MKPYRVTHYRPMPTDKAGWVPLPIITRLAGNLKGPFYFGFDDSDPVSHQEIELLEQNEEFTRVRPAYPINKDERLWLTPNEEVWLASKEDPRGDQRKTLLESRRINFISDDQPDEWAEILEEDSEGSEAVDKSPIISKIIEIGSFRAHYGNYLNSKKYPSKIYKPRWQEELVAKIIGELHEYSGKPIEAEDKFIDTHRYEMIDRLIDSTEPKPTICLEALFLTRERNRIEVVQLGNATHLTLVYTTGGLTQRRLLLEPFVDFPGVFNKWTEALKNADISVCSHANTSADSLMYFARLDNLIGPRIIAQTSVDDLISFIEREPEGVVVCDVGVAYEILAKKASLSMSFVQYDEPIPVGIGFSKADAICGKFLTRLVNKIFGSDDPRIKMSIAETKSRFEELRITWVKEVETRNIIYEE
jgi:hypothetical protein